MRLTPSASGGHGTARAAVEARIALAVRLCTKMMRIRLFMICPVIKAFYELLTAIGRGKARTIEIEEHPLLKTPEVEAIGGDEAPIYDENGAIEPDFLRDVTAAIETGNAQSARARTAA